MGFINVELKKIKKQLTVTKQCDILNTTKQIKPMEGNKHDERNLFEERKTQWYKD